MDGDIVVVVVVHYCFDCYCDWGMRGGGNGVGVGGEDED